MEYIITKYRRGFAVTSQTFIIEASTLKEACRLVNDDEYCGEQLVDITNEEIKWEECKEEWLEDNKGEIIY